jgi:L-ascorbate metabolism protein UlaG (beta-lactamase superfamily)
VEITWYGGGCLRLRGREGVIVADAYRSIVGPTGRGLTADIVTYSHPDPQPVATRGAWAGTPPSTALGRHSAFGIAPPTSLESAFLLDEPGEFEIHDVLVTGVRTYRDDANGAERGPNVTFAYELDGLHCTWLGDIGHLLTQEQLGELGSVHVACVPIGGALSAARAAELVAQVDAKLVVPIPVAVDEGAGAEEMERFIKEMSAQDPVAQPRLSVTISSLPEETTVALLELRRL